MSDRRQDFELLQSFTRDGEQSAFADLVRRHLDLVFATALRRSKTQAWRRKSPRMFSRFWLEKPGWEDLAQREGFALPQLDTEWY